MIALSRFGCVDLERPRRATGDGRRATGDGRRATGDGRRAIGDNCVRYGAVMQRGDGERGSARSRGTGLRVWSWELCVWSLDPAPPVAPNRSAWSQLPAQNSRLQTLSREIARVRLPIRSLTLLGFPPPAAHFTR